MLLGLYLFCDMKHIHLFYPFIKINFGPMKPFSSIVLLFLALNLSAQTAGVLTVTFTPVSHSPCYQGTKNVLAAWIQTSTGGFVKTKLRYAGNSTSDHLPDWAVNSGGSAFNCMSTACNKTDATTGATLNGFTIKSFTWDGKNVNGTSNGTTVADGTYKVTIQETWNHGTNATTIRSYTFTKGPNEDHQTPAADADFKNIKIDWMPGGTASVDAFNASFQLNVYPNPSTGVFNVDYNQTGTLKVLDATGKLVYEELLETTSEATKSIDLSAFENGMYTFQISNSNQISNFKIALLK